jgi:hypothetical protein|tara:strand:- start:245 stop:433 length:189 start_codon:yes stop_codon:yes gene_type:complete
VFDQVFYMPLFITRSHITKAGLKQVVAAQRHKMTVEATILSRAYRDDGTLKIVVGQLPRHAT